MNDNDNYIDKEKKLSLKASIDLFKGVNCYQK